MSALALLLKDRRTSIVSFKPPIIAASPSSGFLDQK